MDRFYAASEPQLTKFSHSHTFLFIDCSEAIAWTAYT